MKYRISMPIERVWCITQLAELRFNNNSIGCTHVWRFSIIYKTRLWYVANVLYEPFRRPSYFFLITVFSFAWPLVSDKIIWELWTSLDQKYIRRKKKGNQPRRSRLGVDTHTCAKFHGLLKSAWTFRYLCRKHVFCQVQPSSRTWVRTHVDVD